MSGAAESSATISIRGLERSAAPLARRVMPLICALGLVAVVTSAVAGHKEAAVLGLLGVAAIGAGWLSLLRTQWTVGESWVSHRGLFGGTNLQVKDLRAIMVPADEVRQGDLLFLGPGLRAVAIPADQLRTSTELANAVAALLDVARQSNVRVTDEAWALVNRPAPQSTADSGDAPDQSGDRRSRLRSLHAA